VTGWWRALQEERTRQLPPGGAQVGIDKLIDAAFQESARADAKSAALLTIVGIGFAAFTAGCASGVAVPLHGSARWLSVAALACVCAVAELLLLALRPRLGGELAGERFFGTWRRYEQAPDVLAAELSADPAACRTLVQLSCVVWRKYVLIRCSVDLLVAVVPLLAAAMSVAVLRLDLTLTPREAGSGRL
jgi:Pycsar effector protein